MDRNNLSRRELKKLQTREKLIGIALELFNKEGVESIGMRQLAQASDLGIGTYYNYFKTKDEIVFAIFDNIFEEIFSQGPDFTDAENLEQALSKNVLKKLQSLDVYQKLLFQFVQTIASPQHYSSMDSEGTVQTGKYIKRYWNYIYQILVKYEVQITGREEHLARYFWHQFMIYVYMWITDQTEGKIHTQSFMAESHHMLTKGI